MGQSAVGWAVTLVCSILRDSISIATNTYRIRNVEGDRYVIDYDGFRVIAHECGPSLVAGCAARPGESRYFAMVRAATRMPSLSESSPAIRCSPQVGFSGAIRLTNSRRFSAADDGRDGATSIARRA